MGNLWGAGYDTNGPRPKPVPMSAKERADFDAFVALIRARRAPPQPEKPDVQGR